MLFQFRQTGKGWSPSARRATFCGGSGGSGWPISIHALREEGDAYEPFHLREKIEISIHALREEGDIQAYRA